MTLFDPRMPHRQSLALTRCLATFGDAQLLKKGECTSDGKPTDVENYDELLHIDSEDDDKKFSHSENLQTESKRKREKSEREQDRARERKKRQREREKQKER